MRIYNLYGTPDATWLGWLLCVPAHMAATTMYKYVLYPVTNGASANPVLLRLFKARTPVLQV